MDRYEEEIFKQIEITAKLLQANWNALKSNPPCENNISNCILFLNEYTKQISEHHEEYKIKLNKYKGVKKARYE